MINTGALAGKTLFITGASRGIGKAIALKAAKDGANIVIAAKTVEPHPKLEGTIYTAAKEVEAAGGRCLPCAVDIREEAQVALAVEGAVVEFGGIDILVNNASAISLTSTLNTEMKRFDLMHTVNTRGTYLTSKCCLPHLKNAKNPHILNLSPPLLMKTHWFQNTLAYTMAKYGMSMCVLGMAEEFKQDGIAVNALWPRTVIDTLAVSMLGAKIPTDSLRKPEIVADAAYAILTKDSRSFTGHFLIDDKVLKEAGITDFDQYAVKPGTPLLADGFISDEDLAELNGLETTVLGESPSSGSEQMDALFFKVKDYINEETVKQIASIYVFNVKGGNSGPYYIDLRNGAGTVGKGQPAEQPDVIFTANEDTYTKLLKGALKAASAAMAGKLNVKGNMGKALKLEKLMNKMKG